MQRYWLIPLEQALIHVSNNFELDFEKIYLVCFQAFSKQGHWRNVSFFRFSLTDETQKTSSCRTCVKSFHGTKNLSELRTETILISNFLMFCSLFILSTESDGRCTQFVEATWFYSPHQLTAAGQWPEGPGSWWCSSYSLFGPFCLLSFLKFCLHIATQY